MKEKKQSIKTVLAVITFTLLMAYFINHASVLLNFFNRILSLLVPFLIGCAIAFVINIPMSNVENRLFSNPEGKLYKFKRIISIVLTYILVVGFVALIVLVVAPEIAATIAKLQEKFPAFVEQIKEEASKYAEKYPELNKEIQNFNPDFNKITGMFIDNGGTILSTTINIFSSIIGTIVNILVGVVFSIYVLAQKERLGKQTKMLFYSIFREKTADEMLVFGKIAHTTFAKFFTCQFREGFILGTMFIVTMSIIRLPYALTIGIIIAITALIPVFGAFIGLFIGCFLILVDTPSKVIVFIITFFVLQNIENYLIYPKLVGGDIGLPPIWVLLAVVVGGDLMGVVGMFVFIPLVSIMYAYAKSIIQRKLKHKMIDVDKKIVPEEVMPLMESRRSSGLKNRHRNVSNIPVVSKGNDKESGEDSPDNK